MPTITKRVGKKGVTYKVQVRKRGYMPETASFLTLAAAQHWARSAETAMDNGQFVRSKNAEKTSLHAALQRYAEEEIPKKAHPKKELSFIKFWQAQAVAKLPLASQRSSDYASLRGAWLRAGLRAANTTDLRTESR